MSVAQKERQAEVSTVKERRATWDEREEMRGRQVIWGRRYVWCPNQEEEWPSDGGCEWAGAKAPFSRDGAIRGPWRPNEILILDPLFSVDGFVKRLSSV